MFEKKEDLGTPLNGFIPHFLKKVDITAPYSSSHTYVCTHTDAYIFTEVHIYWLVGTVPDGSRFFLKVRYEV